MEVFGSAEWGRRSVGDLTRREKIRYLMHAVAYQVSDWGRILNSDQRRKLAILDWDRLIVPDSPVAINAEALLRESSPDYLINHCWRTYIWGAVLSKVDDLRHDPEILFVASMLHDLGHTPEHASCTAQHCFAITGANGARTFLEGQGWSADRSSQVADAIAQHLNMASMLRGASAEAQLLQTGAAFDVVGARHREIDRGFVNEVLDRYPRRHFAEKFSALMKDESTKWPDTRTAVMVRQLQFCARVARTPF